MATTSAPTMTVKKPATPAASSTPSPVAQVRPASPPAAFATSGPADPNGPPMAGKLRTVPVGKTVLLSIVTLGIYMWVRTFKVSGDLHRMPGGYSNWQLMFWLQLIPYVGVVFTLILYYKNTKQANALGQARGVQPTMTPFILACIPIVNIAAPFVWASHYNNIARRV